MKNILPMYGQEIEVLLSGNCLKKKGIGQLILWMDGIKGQKKYRVFVPPIPPNNYTIYSTKKTSKMENRKLKFRFWTPDKRMIDDHEGWVEGIGINEALQASGEYGYKIMQFTGLLDKNKKEIYEGDICLKHYAQDLFPGRQPDTGVIKWVSFGARFTHETKTIFGHHTYCELHENLTNPTYERSLFEVIGNIFENPELISTNPINK